VAAEAVVLLPGFMCDARLYWHQIAALSAEHVVQVGCLTQAASIEEMAEHALADAPPRFALAGHWLGGLVALEMLRRAPERVTRLALLAVSQLPESPAVAAERDLRIARVRAGLMTEVMLEEVPEAAVAPGPSRMDALALQIDMAEALGPEVFFRQSRALMRRPDQQRLLRNTRVRALLMCGEHDTICPPRRHEFLAELMPNARFERLHGAGHLAPLERPDAVSAVLRAWLQEPLA